MNIENFKQLKQTKKEADIPTSVKDIDELRRFLQLNLTKEEYFKKTWKKNC